MIFIVFKDITRTKKKPLPDIRQGQYILYSVIARILLCCLLSGSLCRSLSLSRCLLGLGSEHSLD